MWWLNEAKKKKKNQKKTADEQEIWVIGINELVWQKLLICSYFPI